MIDDASKVRFLKKGDVICTAEYKVPSMSCVNNPMFATTDSYVVLFDCRTIVFDAQLVYVLYEFTVLLP